jgi:hypothetical protein
VELQYLMKQDAVDEPAQADADGEPRGIDWSG